MMVVNQLETLAGAVTPEDFHSHPRHRSLILHPCGQAAIKSQILQSATEQRALPQN